MSGRVYGAAALAVLLAVSAAGCGPDALGPSGGLAAPPEDTAGVAVHWDAWTPYEAPERLYTRRYDDFTGHLIPAADYGRLVPFPGKTMETDWMGPVSLYGLATEKGEVVVDPVYSGATQASGYDREKEQMVFYPFLILEKGDYDASLDEEITRITVAAPDGSWCREGYDRVYGCTAECSMVGTMDGSVEALTPKGDVLWRKTKAELGLTNNDSEVCVMENGMTCYWADGMTCFLSLADGTLHRRPEQEVSVPYTVYRKDLIAAYGWGDAGGYYGCVDHTGAWVIEPVYTSLGTFYGGYAAAQKTDGTWVLIDETGTERLSCAEGELFRSADEDGNVRYINAVQDGVDTYGGYWDFQCYRVIGVWDEAFVRCNDVLQEGDRIIWRYDGFWWKPNGGETAVGWGVKKIAVPIPEGYFIEETLRCGDAVSVKYQTEDIEHSGASFSFLCALYSAEGKEIVPLGTYSSFGSSGSGQILAYHYYSGTARGAVDVLDTAGTVCFSIGGDVLYQNCDSALLVCEEDGSVGFREQDGTWVFRWPVLGDDI